MTELEKRAIEFVREKFPEAMCYLGKVSGRFRIYRDSSDRSTSFIGSGKTKKSAWLDAASYVADQERQ